MENNFICLWQLFHDAQSRYCLNTLFFLSWDIAKIFLCARQSVHTLASSILLPSEGPLFRRHWWDIYASTQSRKKALPVSVQITSSRLSVCIVVSVQCLLNAWIISALQYTFGGQNITLYQKQVLFVWNKHSLFLYLIGFSLTL